MKRKRLIYEVRWVERDGFWWVQRRGDKEFFGSAKRKKAAISIGRKVARKEFEEYGNPSQLLVFNKRQNIARGGRSEASYGCNSRSRG